MARPRMYRRDEVLRRATELFARKGYEGAHLAELVLVTGLNRFSLYKEFGGKEGLFQAVLDGYLERLEELGAHLAREPLGLSNIRAFYGALLDADFPHGCLAVNTIREKHLVPPRVYATIERFAAAAEAAFARNLHAARERRELGSTADPVVIAKLLTSLNFGLMTYGIVLPEPIDRAGALAVLEGILQPAGGTGRSGGSAGAGD